MPIIEPQLPHERAGFRQGRSTEDQVTLLSTHPGHRRQLSGQQVGMVLLDLTAAYDAVWLRGLHLKLLKMVRSKHLVRYIMQISNKPQFHTDD